MFFKKVEMIIWYIAHLVITIVLHTHMFSYFAFFEHGLKYVLFSHNKKMGSAKGAVLLAEMLLEKGKI